MGATTMEEDRELNIHEVAHRLRVHPQTVRARIEKKLIRARKEGLVWRVRESDLRAYIESTYPDGNKREEK